MTDTDRMTCGECAYINLGDKIAGKKMFACRRREIVEDINTDSVRVTKFYVAKRCPACMYLFKEAEI